MLTAIRQWVLRTMMKAKGQTGVVQTLPKREILEINTQVTAQKLMQNGIDPNSLKNADQVENAIISIESRPKVQEGIKSTSSAKVFDLEGKEIKNPKNIMGGKELKNTDEAFEAEIAARMNKENQEALQRIRMKKAKEYKLNLFKNLDDKKKLNDDEYEEFLEEIGGENRLEAYDFDGTAGSAKRILKEDVEYEEYMFDQYTKGNLDPEQPKSNKPITSMDKQINEEFQKGMKEGKFNNVRLKDGRRIESEDDFREYIDELNEDNNFDFAQGGRAGYKFGLGPLLNFLNKKSPMKAYTDYLESVKTRMKAGKEAEVAGEVIPIAAGGALITNQAKKKLKKMNEEQKKKIEEEAQEELRKDMKKADGGRAGFKAGTGKKGLGFLLDLFKPKKSKFDKKRFEEGPIDLAFLENLNPKDLGPYIRTRDTMGRGGYGMYDNFADMPAGLRAAELIKTIKGPRNEINYKAAELFLGKKLRGDESADELIQMLNRQEMRAEGGRIGYKDGPDMGRRTFLKILGGLAAVPILGKFIKPLKVGKTIKKVPIIQTENVPGKPEWFDALVNKVIIEGDDVTKKFATGERQSIHQKDLADGTTVRVTQDIDDGAVRVEYESDANMFEDTVQMEYKKPLPDEGDPNPAAEFKTSESGIVGRADGPDDYSMDIEEVGGTSIKDLDSDVSKLKEYATGQKPTIKEIVQSKRRKDRVKYYQSPDGQVDYVTTRQGDYVPEPDDFASGGIARMLGE